MSDLEPWMTPIGVRSERRLRVAKARLSFAFRRGLEQKETEATKRES